MRPAQRTGTTHPARPVDHFSKKSTITAKIRHFSSHLHTIIRNPQSQTLSTPQYHPLMIIRSHTQPKLLVFFKCIEIVTIRILHPYQIQQRQKLRTARAPLNHSRTRNKSPRSMDTHKKNKGLTINGQCTKHSNGFRERNRYRKTSSYTTEALFATQIPHLHTYPNQSPTHIRHYTITTLN